MMITVSLSGFCQYPIIKKINNQEVIIMTTKQGNDINNQFAKLKDSIDKFQYKLLSVKNTLLDSIKTLNRNQEQISKELRITKNDLAWYQKEVGEYNKSFIQLNAEHRKTMMGLTLCVAVFSSAVVFISKNF